MNSQDGGGPNDPKRPTFPPPPIVGGGVPGPVRPTHSTAIRAQSSLIEEVSKHTADILAKQLLKEVSGPKFHNSMAKSLYETGSHSHSQKWYQKPKASKELTPEEKAKNAIWWLSKISAATIMGVTALFWMFGTYQNMATSADISEILHGHQGNMDAHPPISETVEKLRTETIIPIENKLEKIEIKLDRSELVNELNYYKSEYQQELAEWQRDGRRRPKPRKSDYPKIGELELQLGFQK